MSDTRQNSGPDDENLDPELPGQDWTEAGEDIGDTSRWVQDDAATIDEFPFTDFASAANDETVRGGIADEPSGPVEAARGGIADDEFSNVRGGIEDDEPVEAHPKTHRGGVAADDDPVEAHQESHRGGVYADDDPIRTERPFTPRPPSPPQPPRQTKGWLPWAAAALISAASVGGAAYWVSNQPGPAAVTPPVESNAPSQEIIALKAQAEADARALDDLRKKLDEKTAEPTTPNQEIIALKAQAEADARALDDLRKKLDEKAIDDMVEGQKAGVEAVGERLKLGVSLTPDEMATLDKMVEETPEPAFQLIHSAADLRLVQHQTDEALALAQKARDAAFKTNDVAVQASALRLLALAYDEANQNDEAIKACEEGQALEGIDPSMKSRFRSHEKELKRKKARLVGDPPREPGGGASRRGDAIDLPMMLVAIQEPTTSDLPESLQNALREATAELDETNPHSFAHVADLEIEAGEFFVANQRFDQARQFYRSALDHVSQGQMARDTSPVSYEVERNKRLLQDAQLRALKKLVALPTPSPDDFENRLKEQQAKYEAQLADQSKTLDAQREALDQARSSLATSRELNLDLFMWSANLLDQIQQARTSAASHEALVAALKTIDPNFNESDAKTWASDIASRLRDTGGKDVAALRSQLKNGRKQWVADATTIANLVGYTKPLPPGLDAEFPTSESGAWRQGLITRIQDVADAARIMNSIPPPPVDGVIVGESDLAEGIELLEQHLFDQAEIKLQRASELLADDPRVLFARAIALRGAGRLAEAQVEASRGFSLEQANGVRSMGVDQALARIQSEPRAWVETYRPVNMPPVQRRGSDIGVTER